MCEQNKCIVPIIISVIIGVLIGVLFYTGFITSAIISTPLIFAATFAGVSLILIFIAAVFAIKKETKQCICENGNCVVLGSVGTLIIAITALAYIESLVAASILPAILVGTLGFFVSLTFLSFIALTLCLIKSNCYKKYEHCHYDE